VIALLAVGALAGPADEVLTARLLGTPAAVAASSSEPLGDWSGLWPLAIAGLAAVGVLAAKRWVPRTLLLSDSPLRIAGRVGMGGSASLVLVDADDGAGGVRRLLVSIGGGAPALLADLGESERATVPRTGRHAAGLSLIDEVLTHRRVAGDP